MKQPDVHCGYDKMIALDELKPNPHNPNTHPQKQIALLAQVIQKTGWRHPVIVSKRSGYICTGHGRLQAAQKLKVDAVPVNFQDFKTNAEETEFLLADNKIAELSETDNATLTALLKSCAGIDSSMTGYSETDLAALMKSDPAAELAAAIRSEQEHRIDDAPDPQAVIDGLAGHINRLSDQHPERLRNAFAVILPMGRGHTRDCLILADPSCADAAAELRRHVDDGEKSPVAALMAAVLPMKGDA